jgi:hypothetical protein
MQIDGGGTRLGRLIPFLLDLQPPVVGPAGGTGMLLASSHLPVCQVQFGFIGPLHPHAGASFRSQESGGGGQREGFTPRLIEQVYLTLLR